VFALIVTWLAMLILFYPALLGVVHYRICPCDHPLDLNVFAVLVRGPVANLILRKCMPECWGPFHRFLFQLAAGTPGFLDIVWGLYYMVHHAPPAQRPIPWFFIQQRATFIDRSV